MYVDESGDPGMANSPTTLFCLTGLVVHETDWQPCLSALLGYRAQMRTQFGLKLREEIHAGELLTRPGSLARIAKHDRLTILRKLMDAAEQLPIRVINVVVDKSLHSSPYDPFAAAWQSLIQRFENTIAFQNFPGPANGLDTGLILPYQTDTKKLRGLVRQMRRYNPIPNSGGGGGEGYRQLPIAKVIEDPVFKDSAESLFIQTADCICYMLYQSIIPNKYIQKQTGHGYFRRLDKVLCREASRNDPNGIVRL